MFSAIFSAWKNADPMIIIIVLLMLGLGLLAVLTAGSSLSPDPLYMFFRQVSYALISIIALITGAAINYRRYRFHTQYSFLFTIVLLAAVFVIGYQCWLSFGRYIHFQPSELGKLIIITYLSLMMSVDRGEKMKFFEHSVPIILTCGILIILTALQPDFGTAMVMTGITSYMLFIGSIPLRHLVIPGVLIAPFAAVVPFLYPHVMRRVDYFFRSLKPSIEPWKLGYHDYQNRLAMGSGGWTGMGFGDGIINRTFLPARHTDSIFAVLVEEGGFIVGASAILLFLALFLLGDRTARYSYDPFGAMMARGITFYITMQGFLNIAVVLSLIPNTGVTLPLFSYGGSSLIITMFALGVLINISSQRRIVL